MDKGLKGGVRKYGDTTLNEQGVENLDANLRYHTARLSIGLSELESRSCICTKKKLYQQ